MPSSSRTVLVAALVFGPLLLAACSMNRSAAKPAEVVGVEAAVDAPACADTAVYGAVDALFGRGWLLAYKTNPSDVSLTRCHYVHHPHLDVGPSAPEAPSYALRGDLASHPIVGDGTEARQVLLALPDSSDLGHRCLGPGVVDFDVFHVLDGSGTTVATFQSSDSDACGVRRVIPAS